VFHVHQHPARNLRTLLEIPQERIGAYELNAVLCDGPAGVRMLFGPDAENVEFHEIDPDKAEVIIKTLVQMADFVILDLPSQITPATRAAANLCNYAIVVAEREPISIRAGQVLVKQLHEWGNRGNLVGGVVRVGTVVVTRTIFMSYQMTFDEIQTQMGCGIVGLIPWGPTENLRAQADGVPLVQFSARRRCVTQLYRSRQAAVSGTPSD